MTHFAGSKEIEEGIESYRKSLTEKTSALTLQPSLDEIARRGKHLYNSLLQPVESTIPPGSALLIVPDGNLGYLPGLPKSVALRQAKLHLLRGQNNLWRHPYFRAPFVLVGEGK